MPEQNLIDQLNASGAEQRLAALRRLKSLRDAGDLPVPVRGRDVNNHIHTTYSFSPYSPTKAVWMADRAGLVTAGIMDHDSISGAKEFIEAGAVLGLPTTIGAECRASFADTQLAGRRINNPDQDGVAYVALHGVPHSRIDALTAFFQPVRRARDRRNRLMVERLNGLLSPLNMAIDYEGDVIPLSEWENGGAITERHLLYALALKLDARCDDKSDLPVLLRHKLAVPVSDQDEERLIDGHNPFRAFDLLGVLKRHLVEKFYLEATEECPPIAEVADFARGNGIILAYAYLGDVTASVTGDKKAQTFEDRYLDELFDVLREIGFAAVTYMPSRNTREQLIRLRENCERHAFFQISGEDINQPRQPFVCQAMRDPLFANLYDAAWALIGHEQLAGKSLDNGMFSAKTQRRQPDLNHRIRYYRAAAREIFGNHDPVRHDKTKGGGNPDA